MKEYIDREAMLNERPEGRNLWQGGKEEYNKGWNDCRNAFYKCISGMPAADVVEVRRGRWIKPVPGDGENYCSVCKAEQPWFYGYGYYEPDYCPNCGARMDKENETGILKKI